MVDGVETSNVAQWPRIDLDVHGEQVRLTEVGLEGEVHRCLLVDAVAHSPCHLESLDVGLEYSQVQGLVLAVVVEFE